MGTPARAGGGGTDDHLDGGDGERRGSMSIPGMQLRHRPLDLRLRHTFRIARGASDVRENLLVELEDEGRVGLGEAAPIRRYGEDRASAARAVDEMAARLGDPRAFAVAARAGGGPGQASAEAAVDMALHDLAGQRLGAPLFELLGLDPPAHAADLVHDRPGHAGGGGPEGARGRRLPDPQGEDGLGRRPRGAAGRARHDRPRRCAWTRTRDGRRRARWSAWSGCARLGVEFVEQPLPAASSRRRASCAGRARCRSTPTRACTAPRTSPRWPAPSTASTSSS